MTDSEQRTFSLTVSTSAAAQRSILQLPVTHMAKLSSLTSILADGRIKAYPCDYLDADVCFFTYGVPQYRFVNDPTTDPDQLPIGLMFTPGVLSICEWLYPFDTGAAHGNMFGTNHATLLAPLDKYRVDLHGDIHNARKLVAVCYGSNGNYFDGNPNRPDSLHQPQLNDLLSFLTEDLTTLGVDDRQRTIEAIAICDIQLDASLEWICLPNSRIDDYYDILELTHPNVPTLSRMRDFGVFRPSDVAAEIRSLARAYIVERYGG